MSSFEFPRILVNSCIFQILKAMPDSILASNHRCPWIPMDSHGFPWVPMGSHGFPWESMGSHGSPWDPMGSQWVPMGSPWGPHGDPMGSHGSPYGSKSTFEKTDLDHFSARVFLDFQFSIFLKIFLRNIFSKNMLVRYRGKNNEGVLERPGTKWKVLRAISSTLKCKFSGKCRKVDFSMPCKTKSAENLHV